MMLCDRERGESRMLHGVGRKEPRQQVLVENFDIILSQTTPVYSTKHKLWYTRIPSVFCLPH